MTYNLHKGKNFLGKLYSMEKLKILLDEQYYDVGLFQEVLGNHRFEKSIISQVHLLADEKCNEHSFSRNSFVNDLEHGNSIVSKKKITQKVILDLSVNKFEKRSALLSHIEFENCKLQCICTHLNLLKVDRLKQVKMLVDFIKRNEILGLPLILGGDFNDIDGEVARILIKEVGFTKMEKEHSYPTFPSFFPTFNLDRILFKNIKLVSSEIGKSKMYKFYSDHLPLFYKFEVGSS